MTKILVDSELLERALFSMQEFGYNTKEARDRADTAIIELRAALDAPQQEAVAWQQSAAEVIASFVHLSANPNPDEWALVAVDAIRLLNIPPAHPAPSVPEGEASKNLGELLAVIHGDGGHYAAEHGITKATADAIAKWAALRAAPSVPEGEPTPEMIRAGAQMYGDCLNSTAGFDHHVFMAMLSVAPKATTTDDRNDAERYRFAKSRAYVGVNPHTKRCLWVLRGIDEVSYDAAKTHGFDAAIDAAMAAQKGEKE